MLRYGCGDFLNDYEGIRSYDEFRSDLSLMYFVDIDPANGKLATLEMVPLQIRRFQLNPPSAVDIAWIKQTLDRECRKFGCYVAASDGRLTLNWSRHAKALANL